MLRNIVLIGSMGCGKSHIGRKLANRLRWQFVDTDRRIEKITGCSIAAYYEEYGEDEFRRKEHEIMRQISYYHEAVLSIGGNFVPDRRTLSMLKRYSYIIGLQAEPKAIVHRVKRRMGKRPTMDYDNLESFVQNMVHSWGHVYKQCNLVIDTTSEGPDCIAAAILRHIEKEQLTFAKRKWMP